jgi:hypothetical protein
LIEMTPLLVVAGLTGCATYHPEPLPRRTDLAAGLAGLDLNVPATRDPDPSRRIDIAQPRTIDQTGLLAMLNNPDLKSERGTLDVARVALLQATLPPDPTARRRRAVAGMAGRAEGARAGDRPLLVTAR